MAVVAVVIVYEHCITRNRYHDVCLVSECPAPGLLRPHPVESSEGTVGDIKEDAGNAT